MAITPYYYGTYTAPTSMRIPNIQVSVIDAATGTIQITVEPVSGAQTYGGAYASYKITDPDGTWGGSGTTFTETGLIPGIVYTLIGRAWTGANFTGTYGQYIEINFSIPKSAPVGGIIATTSTTVIPSTTTKIDISNQTETDTGSVPTAISYPTGTTVAVSGNKQVSRSLFKVTNNSTSKKAFSVAEKNSGISTGYSYYSFGTGMFFPSSVSNTDNAGGIGFFTSGGGHNGYYVLMQTTSNLSTTADKSIKILKVADGRVKLLNDSQKDDSKTLTGVLGGESYKVDIKVAVSSDAIVIDVYVNNFKISAVDANKPSSTDKLEKLLPVTSNIAMFTSVGSAYFDYIYATPLELDQYNSGIMQNIYNGQYGTTTLNFLFGEKILSNFNKAIIKNGYLEEFGTVARELRKVNIKYESRPGYPLYPSVGINKFVDVLGARLTSFGAEVYIINNAGTYVPLDDSGIHSFSIVGNYVVQSGQHEYVDGTINQYSNPEPVIFDSTWIQTENDAKSLSNWIKTQWSKQQVTLNMQVFGNPLISIGDIVTVNYSANGLDGTQKFVIVSINTSYNQGLETTLVARSIYS